MTVWISLAPLTLLATSASAHELPVSLDPSMDIAVELATPLPSSEAREVFDFWRAAGPALWFAKDAAFDASFRKRFLIDHEAAARGELEHWMATPEGALALVVLLDRYLDHGGYQG